jgi:ankyrin repeat protein
MEVIMKSLVKLFVFLSIFSCSIFGMESRADDVNSQLLTAIMQGDLPAVESFVASGADVLNPDFYGVIPIFIAAKNGDKETFDILLSACDKKLPHFYTIYSDYYYGMGIFHYAAQGGNVEIMKSLVEKYGEGNLVEDTHEACPLVLAAWCGKVEMVRYLRQLGHYRRMFLRDTTRGSYGIIKKLVRMLFDKIRADRSLNEISAVLAAEILADSRLSTYCTTPLIEACNRGRTDLVEVLTDLGADPNFSCPEATIRIECGNDFAIAPVSCLTAAFATRQFQVLRMLHSRGLVPSAAELNFMRISLLGGIKAGNVDMVRTFVEIGLDVNLTFDFMGDGNQWNFLILSIYFGRFEITRLLLELGATDTHGTAYNYALQIGRNDIAEIISRYTRALEESRLSEGG